MLCIRLGALCWFAAAAIAQTVPGDTQKLLDRLDKLEKQNEAMQAEIRELRQELAERVQVEEARTAELAQTKVEASQRMPVSLTGMLLFNAFLSGKYGGTLQHPIFAAATPGTRSSRAAFRHTVLD